MKTRQPTGQVPYPVVLVEGEEKAGKSYACAQLSASEKVGQTYWIDLGEGGADEYGLIEGARYLVVEHDGSYAAVLECIEEIRVEAQRAKDAGEPPVVLVIDSMTGLWDGLKDWVSLRAKSREKNKAKLRQDPNAEIDITMDLWNDASARHSRVMTLLLTFPGIVALTARGKEVAEMDKAGKPVNGRKAWKVEGQKNLAYDATVWLRLTRTEPPIVVGARSVYVGLIPGRDEPQPITAQPDNLLEWLIFDVLKVDPGKAQVRDMQPLTGGAPTDDETVFEGGKATRSRQAEPDQWSKPVETADPAWVIDWKIRAANAETLEALGTLWEELLVERRAHKVSDIDLAACEEMKNAAKDDFAKQSAA